MDSAPLNFPSSAHRSYRSHILNNYAVLLQHFSQQDADGITPESKANHASGDSKSIPGFNV